MPWTSKTDMDTIEKVQLEAARVVTGLTKSTPTEALLIEAELPSIRERLKALELIAVERSRRLERNNPRRLIAEKTGRQRLKKEGWRDNATVKWKELMDKETVHDDWIFPKPLAPWTKIDRTEYIIEGKKVENQERNKAMARAKLNDNDTYDFVIYTDGSASEGRMKGGAAAVVTKGTFEEPEVVERIKVAAGKWCSSYQAEMIAMEKALSWLESKAYEWHTARIVTDSKSSLESMKKFKYGTKNVLLRRVYQLLSNLTGTLQLVWVPSHCGIPGNDLADTLANEAAMMDQEETGWLFEVAKARIWNRNERKPIEHDRVRRTYPEGKLGEELEELVKEEEISFRRFRTGHSLELKSYKHRLGLTDDDLCRLCGEEAETTEHVIMNCTGTLQLRSLENINQMSDLSRRPRPCWRIWNWFRKKSLNSQ